MPVVVLPCFVLNRSRRFNHVYMYMYTGLELISILVVYSPELISILVVYWVELISILVVYSPELISILVVYWVELISILVVYSPELISILVVYRPCGSMLLVVRVVVISILARVD